MPILLLAPLAWLAGQGAAAQQVATAVPELIPLAEAGPATPAVQRLARAQEAFRSTIGSDPEDSLEHARAIVSLTVAAFGPEHVNVSRALTNLAIVQAAAGEHRLAIENFTAAIAQRESATGTLVGGQLVNPLVGLAGALVAAGEIEAAILVYQRAVHITHVNEGPANVEQVTLIDALGEVYAAIGDRRETARMQDMRFRLLQRRYEPTSDQFIDALEHRARWATQAGEVELAAQCYARIVARLEERFGEDDPRLVEPLMEFALVSMGRETGRYARTEQGLLQEARRAALRAERIARSHAAEDPALLARTLVRQGDWMRAVGMVRPAFETYGEAWALMDGDPELAALRTDLFGAPETIRAVAMDDIYDKPDAVDVDPRSYPEAGYVEVRYGVDDMGRATNIELVDSEPAGLMDVHVQRALQGYVFRPEFRDGSPVLHEGLTYRHGFRYDPSLFSDTERAFIERMENERKARVSAQRGADDTANEG